MTTRTRGYALPRELWTVPGERSFLLDTSIESEVPLIRNCPEGVDRSEWVAGVLEVSRLIEATGQPIAWGYDRQPTLTFVFSERRRSEINQGSSKQKSGAET